MESVEFYKPNNAFLNYLADCLCKSARKEQKVEVYTTDGDIICEQDMADAVKNGNGVIIGGFFVGASLSSDLDYDFNYSFSI